jgi:photosystem II stability/assembly factor-like uncharacterized protein
LAVDSQDGRTLYADEQGLGLFKSSDAGVHWSRLQTVSRSSRAQAVAIDPRHPHTVYFAHCAGACTGGVLQRTDDGGATWWTDHGIPSAVQSLAIDPQHSSTVFAGTMRGEIFRSSGVARSWQRVATAPALPSSHLYAVVAIVIDPRDPDNVYAGRRNGGIIKSSDGGKTWRRANTGLTERGIVALAIDPRDSRVLYASTVRLWTGTNPRVFRSTDGARTWHPLSAGLPAVGVNAFAVDPSGRGVFAATGGDGVVQLRDGG